MLLVWFGWWRSDSNVCFILLVVSQHTFNVFDEWRVLVLWSLFFPSLILVYLISFVIAFGFIAAGFRLRPGVGWKRVSRFCLCVLAFFAFRL